MHIRKINILPAVDEKIANVWEPHVLGDVNNAQVKVAKFGECFDWHSHDAEDEAFLVLRGKIAVDFRDQSIEMDEGDFLLVPMGVEHRPRALSHEPVVLMFEPSTTLNTGGIVSDKTVTDLAYL